MSVARVGVEPTDREGLSFAALPVCVPRYLRQIKKASPVGFEPTISTVTGWRALRAAPRGRVVRDWFPKQESNLQTLGFKPSRSASWRIRAEVVPDGLEPPLPGCRPGVVAAGTRDHVGSGSRETRTRNGVNRTCFRDRLLIRPDDFRKVPGVGIEPTPSTTTASRRCPEPGVTTSSNCPGISLHKRHATLIAVRGQFGEQDLNLHHRVQSPAACR
jgi:hypothetical protein